MDEFRDFNRLKIHQSVWILEPKNGGGISKRKQESKKGKKNRKNDMYITAKKSQMIEIIQLSLKVKLMIFFNLKSFFFS